MAEPSERGNAGKPSRSQRWVAGVLLVCVAVVVFWQVMASRSRSPLRPFELTAEDLRAFDLRSGEWSSRRLPVNSTPTEPNVLAYALERKGVGDGSLAPFARFPIRIRLLHGYNMCDCMRMKGYRVDLLADTRRELGAAPDAGSNGRAAAAGVVPEGHQAQIWRLTSETGDVGLNISGMLRAGDFAETGIDMRSMAFPRIGVPDEPGWLPQGLRLSSLKHPIRNFGLLLRAKWNNARCDLATFLRLKQPAWASEELMTLLVESQSPSAVSADEPAALREVTAAYLYVQRELQSWRERQTGGPPSP